jgi:hypothetical protein
MKRAYKTEILLSEKQRKKSIKPLEFVDMYIICIYLRHKSITRKHINTCQDMSSLNG